MSRQCRGALQHRSTEFPFERGQGKKVIVRKLRLQRGWSQEHLAQLTGLSVRTIQRIERGQKAGLESLSSLASVLEINIEDLQEEAEMKTDLKLTIEEQEAIEYVRDIKSFYSHVLTYLFWIGVMLTVNLIQSPDHFWVVWPALGWGVGVIAHGISTFEVFSPFNADWEKRQVEKRLGRKL